MEMRPGVAAGKGREGALFAEHLTSARPGWAFPTCFLLQTKPLSHLGSRISQYPHCSEAQRGSPAPVHPTPPHPTAGPGQPASAPSGSLQPVPNHNPWMLLYFISFLLIVSFFVLNMFVGVVVENFHKCRQHQEAEEARRREEKRLRRLEKKRRSE